MKLYNPHQKDCLTCLRLWCQNQNHCSLSWTRSTHCVKYCMSPMFIKELLYNVKELFSFLCTVSWAVRVSELTASLTCVLFVLTCVRICVVSIKDIYSNISFVSIVLLVLSFHLLFPSPSPFFSSIFPNPSPRAHCVSVHDSHTHTQNTDLDWADGDRIHFFPD